MVSSIKFNEIDKLSDKLNKAKLAIPFKLMEYLYEYNMNMSGCVGVVDIVYKYMVTKDLE